jgi:hypothetical protein
MRVQFKPAAETPAVRLPAVAGQFYPENPEELRTMVDGFLAAAKTVSDKIPKAIIAPHAGYPYSGPIAGSAYACLARGRGLLKRVVLLGPSHFMVFPGLAASRASVFQSPLDPIPVEEEALARVRALPLVTTLDAAHQREHSLEVHLPFLQIALGEFKLVPLVVGDATANLFPDMSPRKKVTSGRVGGQCERTALLERWLWLMQAVEAVRRIDGGIGHVVFQRGDDGFVRDVGPVGLEQ